MAASLRYGVELRAAVAADAAELARLLGQAVAPPDPAAVAARLEAMRDRTDCAVLVATGYGSLSGFVALHWAPTLSEPRPVAQITSLVVDAGERRHGIGRLLLKAASQAARAGGCDLLLAAAGSIADDASLFYQANGFTPAGPVFTRPLRRRAD